MSEDEHVKLRRVEGDLELINARIDGLRDNLLSMSEELLDTIQNVSTIAQAVTEMRAKAIEAAVGTPVSSIETNERRVWVMAVPEGDEWGVGPCEVMVEQFGNKAPTIAFRRASNMTGSAGVWGRPYSGEAR